MEAESRTLRISLRGDERSNRAASSARTPGIGGSIVAWEDNAFGAFDIVAKDLPTGVVKRITTATGGQNNAHPNVSGTSIVYATLTATSTQIFVTDFTTPVTRQLTTTGNNSSPDISGTHVVYQGVRAGEQDIFVFDLTTGTETRVSRPGIQRNPHVSGDWVTFEHVNTGRSAVRLYHIPSGSLFTVPALSTTRGDAFLNEIDVPLPGTGRVVYTAPFGTTTHLVV